MTKIFILLGLLFSFNSYAANTGQWYKILTCNNDNFIIDKALVGSNGPYKSYSYQVVIKDLETFNFFQNHGLSYTGRTINHEWILEFEYDSSFDSFTSPSSHTSYTITYDNDDAVATMEGYNVNSGIRESLDLYDCKEHDFPN